MQEKYSKHFIYNWLRSDLFGEYTFYKSHSELAKKILKKIWTYATRNWRSKKRSLVKKRYGLHGKLQKILSLIYNSHSRLSAFSMSRARGVSDGFYKLKLPLDLIRNDYWITSYKKNKKKYFAAIPQKQSLLNSILLYKKNKKKYFLNPFEQNSSSVSKILLLRRIYRRMISQRKRKNKKKLLRYHVSWSMSTLKSLKTKFKRVDRRLRKHKKLSRDGRVIWMYRISTKKRSLIASFFEPSKPSINHLVAYSRFWRKKRGRAYMRYRRFLKTTYRSRWWRMRNLYPKRIYAKKTPLLSRINKIYYPSKVYLLSRKGRSFLQYKNPTIYLTKTLLYLTTWNSFIRTMKWGMNRIKYGRQDDVFRDRRQYYSGYKFRPHFIYTGVYKPRKRVVKKPERKALLNFRLLQYFGLVETPADLLNKFKGYVYSAKKLTLPTLTRIEFTLPTILLRAGFLENGYVATSLAKRNLFLVNGVPATSNSVLSVWDIITVAQPLWWMIYARFRHFFSRLTGFLPSSPMFKKKPLRSNFVLYVLKKSYYLRKSFRFMSREKQKKMRRKLGRKFIRRFGTYWRKWPKVKRHILSSRNLILALPPAYMEVSFKLFLIVLWRLVSNPVEITKPFNLRSVRSLVFNKKKLSSTPLVIGVSTKTLG